MTARPCPLHPDGLHLDRTLSSESNCTHKYFTQLYHSSNQIQMREAEALSKTFQLTLHNFAYHWPYEIRCHS